MAEPGDVVAGSLPVRRRSPFLVGSLLRFFALCRGFVGYWLGSQEIVLETRGVRIEELTDKIVAVRFYNETGMVVFLDAIDDFGVGVGARVGMFLASQA